MLMRPEQIASLPIWAAGLLMGGLTIFAAVAVELVVRRVVPMNVRQDHSGAASAILTVIGTTYAVLLAFVAMLAWEGYIKAQAITDAEASLVQNVYQLIDGLDGPERASMRRDIVAYTAAVVRTEWPAQARGASVAEDEPALSSVTRTALHLRPDNIADGNLHRLLLGDLGQLGSARRERLLAGRPSIPPIVWFVLIAGGGISVVFASFLGSPSLRMHLAMSSLLVVSGVLVLLVIVALSNPFRGDNRISAEPFERVLARMEQE